MMRNMDKMDRVNGTHPPVSDKKAPGWTPKVDGKLNGYRKRQEGWEEGRLGQKDRTRSGKHMGEAKSDRKRKLS